MEALLRNIDYLKDTMISVSTGGGQIQDCNDEYKKQFRSAAQELRRLGIQNPNTYSDLWQWYGKWKAGDMPRYQDRRTFIANLYVDALTQIENLNNTHEEMDVPLQGWDRIERTIGEIKYRLSEASNEEQFQAVGLLCRDAIISLAQQVYDRQQHPSTDGVEASSTDGKRMLDSYFAVVLAGQDNETIRRYAKATNALANDLTHNRTATRRLAKLCSSSCINLVNLVRILQD